MKVVQLHGNSLITFFEVARQISHQTGYDIIFDDELLKETVFKVEGENTVDELLKRILKGKNFALLFDDSKKEIIVRGFGDKASNSFVRISSSSGKDNIGNITKLEMNKVNEKIAENKEKMAKLVKNINLLDPVSGVSYVEIEKSLNKITEKLKDSKTIDSVSGKTFSNINQSVAKNGERINNSMDAIDPITGKKNKIINESIQKRKNIENGIDPVTGKSYREINAIIARGNQR